MTDLEYLPYHVEEEKYACATLFPFQKYIREDIESKMQMGVCSYTGNNAYVLPLSYIVQKVYNAFVQIFEDPAEELPFESGGEWDELDGSGFHKEGAGYILPDRRSIMTTEEALEMVGFRPMSDELFNDVAASFQNDAWVLKDAFDFTPDERLHDNWDSFSKSTIKDTLDGVDYDTIYGKHASLLSYLAEVIASNLHALKHTLKAGHELYRCVNYEPVPSPLTASHLWAPPVQYATTQRMSRQGQSRFYASFDKETPLREAVVNKAGEHKCLGIFELKSSINVLDFTNIPLPFILNCPDVFAFQYFREFARAITLPVNDGEKEKYVPTQMMRDMIESKFINQGIMGIKYRSVKGDNTTNVVLFLDNDTCANYLSLKNYEIH